MTRPDMSMKWERCVPVAHVQRGLHFVPVVAKRAPPAHSDPTECELFCRRLIATKPPSSGSVVIILSKSPA